MKTSQTSRIKKHDGKNEGALLTIVCFIGLVLFATVVMVSILVIESNAPQI